MSKMYEILSKKVNIENIVGKEENAGFQHFLCFHHCFQKPSLPKYSANFGLFGRQLIVILFCYVH